MRRLKKVKGRTNQFPLLQRIKEEETRGKRVVVEAPNKIAGENRPEAGKGQREE